MKKDVTLVQNGMGNIQRCCHGVVHIHLHNGVSLRFSEDAFSNFASMAKEASSRLMDENLANLFDEER